MPLPVPRSAMRTALPRLDQSRGVMGQEDGVLAKPETGPVLDDPHSVPLQVLDRLSVINRHRSVRRRT